MIPLQIAENLGTSGATGVCASGESAEFAADLVALHPEQIIGSFSERAESFYLSRNMIKGVYHEAQVDTSK